MKKWYFCLCSSLRNHGNSLSTWAAAARVSPLFSWGKGCLCHCPRSEKLLWIQVLPVIHFGTQFQFCGCFVLSGEIDQLAMFCWIVEGVKIMKCDIRKCTSILQNAHEIWQFCPGLWEKRANMVFIGQHWHHGANSGLERGISLSTNVGSQGQRSYLLFLQQNRALAHKGTADATLAVTVVLADIHRGLTLYSAPCHVLLIHYLTYLSQQTCEAVTIITFILRVKMLRLAWLVRDKLGFEPKSVWLHKILTLTHGLRWELSGLENSLSVTPNLHPQIWAIGISGSFLGSPACGPVFLVLIFSCNWGLRLQSLLLSGDLEHSCLLLEITRWA